MSAANEKIKKKLNALQKAYAQRLPEKVSAIERIWASLLHGQWNENAFQSLHRLTHSLTGSGATYGLAELSDTARMLETLAMIILESGCKPTVEQKTQISTLVETLKQVSLLPAENSHAFTLEEPASYPHSTPQAAENKLVFLVEDDTVLAKSLTAGIENLGYSVRTFYQLDGFKQAVFDLSPAAVIMDVVFPQGNLAGTDVIWEIQQSRQTPLPVIFISARDDFNARLQAVRAGGTHYLTKPLHFKKLIEVLDALTERKPKEPYRILIVDDDVPLAAYYALTLEQAGMVTTTVNDPLNASEFLVSFKPELILMDVYMPGCSGMELAAVIRQQNVYAGIPIVFLSTESNFDRQLAAMNLGGDDFLSKPIQPAHLIAAVTARVQRARQLNSITSELRTTLLELERAYTEVK